MTSRDDERRRRGKALADALEARRSGRKGLTQGKLLLWSGLSAPTWAAAVQGRAEEESYDTFERGIRIYDERPDDFAQAVAQRKQERRSAPPAAGPEDLVIRGMRLRDRVAEEIRIPHEYLGSPGEVRRILDEIFGVDDRTDDTQ